MQHVHEVTLELVRPGPPHNQLLSPLTPYMALCGGGSPITFRIDFEHRQLLNRLERLRYVTPNEDGSFASVPPGLRQAQVRELGEEMGKILARIPSLNAELSRAHSGSKSAEGSEFVQVRLMLSGSELSILPFELARAPQSYPGEGLDLSLQGSLPVVITREIRRSRPLPVSWSDRHPKVLFLFAEPSGLSVPKTEHLFALRDALDPWIELPASPSEQVLKTKEHLRVVPNASIEDIYELCSKETYTHIHVLAHGDHYLDAGEQRFGLALCQKGDPTAKQVVDGQRLAKALRAENEGGVSRSQPLVVTLCTCDSGQQGSVLVPGGSIAHDLHAAGIPWVFASQFPLTKAGSVRITEYLYPRLLRGDDPRLVLFELRRRMSMAAKDEHDWASIVTYATIENNLELEVAKFFEKQTIAAINEQLARAYRVVSSETTAKQSSEERKSKVQTTVDAIHGLLSRWERRIPPAGGSPDDRMTRTTCFGMKGSFLKQMGLFHASIGDQPKAKSELNLAREAYHQALHEWVTEEARFNWAASQYLALCAVLDSEKNQGIYAVCRQLAERDLQDSDRSIQAWAHGTLAELTLLSSFHDVAVDDTVLKKNVLDHCKKIVELTSAESRQAVSTCRQFKRYADKWQLKDWKQEKWSEIAEAAVNALSPKA